VKAVVLTEALLNISTTLHDVSFHNTVLFFRTQVALSLV